MSRADDRDPAGPKQSWRPPTRRAFVAMLSAAAAAIAVRTSLHSEAPVVAADPPRRPWSGKTRWIGHC